MNIEDIGCIRKDVTLTDEEKKTVLSLVNRNKLDIISGKQLMEIKRKKDLKNYRMLVVKTIFSDIDALHLMLGLVDVNVDDEKGELTGTRVLRYRGECMFEKYLFYLKDYKKKWKAWG